MGSMSHSSLGFRFLPTNEEALFHLRRKIENPDYRHPAIFEADIYAQPPEGLPWYPDMNYLFHGKERYFFNFRKKRKRTVEEAGGSIVGHWHGSTGSKSIHGLGYVSGFVYFVKDGQGKDVKTDWIMYEFLINKNAQQQWALCKIRFNGKEVPLIASPGSASNVAVEVEGSDDDDDNIPLPEAPSKQAIPLNFTCNRKNRSGRRCRRC